MKNKGIKDRVNVRALRWQCSFLYLRKNAEFSSDQAILKIESTNERKDSKMKNEISNIVTSLGRDGSAIALIGEVW